MKVHGMYALPDRRALADDGYREYLYLVKIQACELWGEQADPNSTLCIDLWESYLSDESD
jgi:nitrile hydratase